MVLRKEIGPIVHVQVKPWLLALFGIQVLDTDAQGMEGHVANERWDVNIEIVDAKPTHHRMPIELEQDIDNAQAWG